MKALTIITLALFGLIAAPLIANAQSDKASQQAKTYTKQGYKTMPAKAALDKQIQGAWIAQTKTESDGQATYFIANAIATGPNYNIAKTMADNQAKADIVNQIGAKVEQVVQVNIANLDLGGGDVESLSEMITHSKTVAAHSLGRTSTLVEIYRDLPAGKVEVIVTVAYSVKDAMGEVGKSLRAQLSEQTGKLAAELGQILKGIQ